jgi:hypothetical protein
MAEYVEISSGVGEIISIANGLRTRGQQLQATMQSTNAEIEALEGGPETLPVDDFSDQFRTRYYEPSQDSRGDDADANLAVRNSAEDKGVKLTELGEFAAGAMFAFSGGDEDNATDISTARDD